MAAFDFLNYMQEQAANAGGAGNTALRPGTAPGATPQLGGAAPPLATPQFGGITNATPTPLAAPVSPATPQSQSAQNINTIYDDRLAGMMGQLQSGYQSTLGGLNQQIGQMPAQYQQLRDRAFVDSLMQKNRSAEQLANLGYSGGGGLSQTLQGRNNTQLLNTLGGANLGQQQATDAFGLQLTDLENQYNADILSGRAQIEGQRGEALLNNQDSTMNTAMQLLQMGRITPAQFKEMTGVDVQNISRGGGGGGGYSDEDNYMWLIQQGYTDDEARAQVPGYAGYNKDPKSFGPPSRQVVPKSVDDRGLIRAQGQFRDNNLGLF